MSRFTRPAPHWITAIVLSVILALSAAEAVLRLDLIPVPVVYESYWFSDHPGTFRDQHRAFGYAPYTTNHETVLVADMTQAVMEHHARFQTNNAGLVQRRDIRPETSYTVVVGDSFTQGVGARPWFYDLEGEFPELPLANLGIAGTGVAHWARAVDWFAREVAPVEDLVVLFITDDFVRPYWQARVSEESVSFCTDDDCQLVTTRWRSGSPGELLRMRRELNAPPSSLSRWTQEGLRHLLSQFRLGQFVVNLRRRYLAQREPTWLEENKRLFSEMLRRRPARFALHLPQKEEAAAGRWSPESRSIHRFVEETGVRTIDGLARCGLTADGFYPHDPHPNASGYAMIRRCLADVLGEELSRRHPATPYAQAAR